MPGHAGTTRCVCAGGLMKPHVADAARALHARCVRFASGHDSCANWTQTAALRIANTHAFAHKAACPSRLRRSIYVLPPYAAWNHLAQLSSRLARTRRDFGRAYQRAHGVRMHACFCAADGPQPDRLYVCSWWAGPGANASEHCAFPKSRGAEHPHAPLPYRQTHDGRRCRLLRLATWKHGHPRARM